MSQHCASKPAALVTGCAGFIASHLTQALLAQGFCVAGVDNLLSGKTENMAGFADNPDFHFFRQPFETPELLGQIQEVLPGINIAFHLAAIVSVPWSMSHAEETLRVNFEATRALHAACRAAGFTAFVFAGSAAEYGDDERLPLREDMASDASHQLSPYGRAKYLASREIIQSGFGTVLRGFNIYGPRQDPSSPYSGVVSQFIARGLAGQSLNIYGDGKQSRDFIFVQDMVRAYLRLAGVGEGLGQPCHGAYNAGQGKEVSVLELAQICNRLTANPAPLNYLPSREGDIARSLADVGKLNALGFTARTSLEEGLRETIEWFKGN